MGFAEISVSRIFRIYCKLWEFFGLYSTTLTTVPDPSSLRQWLQPHKSRALGTVCFLYLISHTWSTVSRARRYTPEFVQCLFEDLTLNVVYWEVYAMCYTEHKFLDIIELVEKMTPTTTEQKIRKQVGRKVVTILVTFVLNCFLMLFSISLQACIPLSEEDIRIRAFVYADTRYPQRTLPTMVKVPGVDETESWNYEVMLCAQLFFGAPLFIALMAIGTMIPLCVVHLEGQYAVLAKKIRLLGRQEYYHLTIEEDAKKKYQKTSYLKLYQPQSKKSTSVSISKLLTRDKKEEERLKREENKMLDQLYLREIIQTHQMLLQFQEKVTRFMAPFMIPLNLMCYVYIALSLFQLVINPSSISGLRFFRFLSELFVVIAVYFLLCDASEWMDNCSECLVRAVQDSEWRRCGLDTQRSLCLMLRRLQRCNKLSLYQGIVLSRPQFLSVINMGYSFASTMRVQVI